MSICGVLVAATGTLGSGVLTGVVVGGTNVEELAVVETEVGVVLIELFGASSRIN